LLRGLVSRLFAIGSRTWILIGVAMAILAVLAIWAAISVAGWLFGVVREGVAVAPEAARAVSAQVEQVIPGARERLGEWVPALEPELPPRDVSGADIGPVARFPGLVRSHWHRDGREITVRYEGRADYVAVLDHYVRGFTAEGYAQTVMSATPAGEEHEYRKGDERIRFEIAQLPQGKVAATLVAVLP
jgi:hypothetical protein